MGAICLQIVNKFLHTRKIDRAVTIDLRTMPLQCTDISIIDHAVCIAIYDDTMV